MINELMNVLGLCGTFMAHFNSPVSLSDIKLKLKHLSHQSLTVRHTCSKRCSQTLLSPLTRFTLFLRADTVVQSCATATEKHYGEYNALTPAVVRSESCILRLISESGLCCIGKQVAGGPDVGSEL